MVWLIKKQIKSIHHSGPDHKQKSHDRISLSAVLIKMIQKGYVIITPAIIEYILIYIYIVNYYIIDLPYLFIRI